MICSTLGERERGGGGVHCALYLTSKAGFWPLQVAGLLPPAVSMRYTVSMPPWLRPLVSLSSSHLIAPSAVVPGHDDVGALVSLSLATTLSGYGDGDIWSRANTGDAPLKKWWPIRCSKPSDCRFCVNRVGCEESDSARGEMEGMVHLAKGLLLRWVPMS